MSAHYDGAQFLYRTLGPDRLLIQSSVIFYMELQQMSVRFHRFLSLILSLGRLGH